MTPRELRQYIFTIQLACIYGSIIENYSPREACAIFVESIIKLFLFHVHVRTERLQRLQREAERQQIEAERERIIEAIRAQVAAREAERVQTRANHLSILNHNPHAERLLRAGFPPELIPEYYVCSLTCQIMVKAILLSAGKERVNEPFIKSYLLSNPSDPFTRRPLTSSELDEDKLLTRRINQFIVLMESISSTLKKQSIKEIKEIVESAEAWLDKYFPMSIHWTYDRMLAEHNLYLSVQLPFFKVLYTTVYHLLHQQKNNSSVAEIRKIMFFNMFLNQNTEMPATEAAIKLLNYKQN